MFCSFLRRVFSRFRTKTKLYCTAQYNPENVKFTSTVPLIFLQMCDASIIAENEVLHIEWEELWGVQFRCEGLCKSKVIIYW